MIDFKNKKILVVVAHPDDELLGLGAAIHKLINEKNCQVRAIILGEGITSRSDKRNPVKWSEELKIHCNLCNQFFHCKIAGACRGDDCQVIKHTGYRHRARYCMDCVSRVYDNNECLCKECFMKEY